MTTVIPFVLRGQVYDNPDLTYRHPNGIAFGYPDPQKLIGQATLNDPVRLRTDFARVSVSEIIAFLAKAGRAMRLENNPRMQAAYEFTVRFSALTAPIVRASYDLLPVVFSRAALRAMVENEIGSRYLDGWVDLPYTLQNARIRAYGTRMLHYLSGNVPMVAALSMARAALVKSDNIIRVPVNDPLTAQAILEAMIAVDPQHPVVRHFSALFWEPESGIEETLFTPRYLEKIISWGGALGAANAAENHGDLSAAGIDVLELGPRVSMSIIGREGFRSEKTMQRLVKLAAKDAASFNMQSCGSSRFQFVQCDNETAIAYAKLLYAAMQEQEPGFSTKPRSFPATLQANLDAIRDGGFYRVIGGNDGEGAAVVSLAEETVDFIPTDKVVNVIPFERMEDVLEKIPPSIQTAGIYPLSLRKEWREALIARGVCRLIDIGYTADYTVGAPFNNQPVLARMCRWVLDEQRPKSRPLFYAKKVGQIISHHIFGGIA
ncbi:MAG: hypothetical protein L3J16_02910 [Anaerolineales bacterium]|nr:hypothetical protein [Anaerolineales bacterium]